MEDLLNAALELVSFIIDPEEPIRSFLIPRLKSLNENLSMFAFTGYSSGIFLLAFGYVYSFNRVLATISVPFFGIVIYLVLGEYKDEFTVFLVIAFALALALNKFFAFAATMKAGGYVGTYPLIPDFPDRS